jgi:LssY-like putative type I secretion system component LssY
MGLWKSRWLGIPYSPHPEERTHLDRAEVRKDEALVVRASVLANRESERFFGVPLARRGIQPVWLEITNHGGHPYRLRLASLDPNYYPPLEAAYVNHFRIVRRLLAFGALAWLFFLPLLVLLPFKLLAARAANRRMNAYFQEHGFGWGLIRPGDTKEGFVFTTLDEGTKLFSVKLLGPGGAREYAFAVPVPGLKVDYARKPLECPANGEGPIECDEDGLRKRLVALPRSTTNRRGTVEGDPLNLVVIGEFDTVLGGFGARWDETEAISLQSCLRTFKAFSLGSSYRYSPLSSLFVYGRSQDFALQRARQVINERLHLRLWLTPMRFKGRPVWVGQISRDIGVRFTPKTWNLTTHKVDPDVDDARDYLLDELLESGRVGLVGYVPGAQAADRASPRHNLTGDPYFTDGLRAVIEFEDQRTTPTLVNWT